MHYMIPFMMKQNTWIYNNDFHSWMSTSTPYCRISCRCFTFTKVCNEINGQIFCSYFVFIMVVKRLMLTETVRTVFPFLK